MHIKHYHPQLFKKAKFCAPNVADLAYARTVGDHLDHHKSASYDLTSSHSATPSRVGTSSKRIDRLFTETKDKKSATRLDVGYSSPHVKINKESKKKADNIKKELSTVSYISKVDNIHIFTLINDNNNNYNNIKVSPL